MSKFDLIESPNGDGYFGFISDSLHIYHTTSVANLSMCDCLKLYTWSAVIDLLKFIVIIRELTIIFIIFIIVYT